MSEDFKKEFQGTKIFEGDSTVSQNAGHIQKILILEKKEKMLYSWSSYNSAKEGTGERESNKRKLESAILSNLLDIWEVMSRKKEEPEKISELVKKGDYFTAIKEVNKFLDKVGLTKFDTKKDYDRTNIVISNKANGY